MYDWLFTIIYLNAALAMEKYRKPILIVAVIAMFFELGSTWLDLETISFISRGLNVIFFVYIVFNFIFMIARSKEVNAKVILESINGYLLLGLVFSLMIASSMMYDPTSFKFPETALVYSDQVNNFSDYLYYGLVTLSTLGYGDVVPTMPFSKSLSVFTSIAGQLYIAIIIAMLVGKYASQKNED